MPALDYYIPTINAYSSILIPRDDGSITVSGIAPVGTVTIQGVVLTAAPGARVTGIAPTFDSSLGTAALIATSIQDAINDPLNPFQALGVNAKSFAGVVGLRRTDPSIALVDACSNVSVLQAVIGDFAAGSLSRQVTPLHLETFGAQVCRWIRTGADAHTFWNYSDAVPQDLVDPGFELHVEEDEAIILFDELDAQAEFYLVPGARFADLPVGPTFPATNGTQQAVVDALLSGTLVIRGDSGLTSAQMRVLAEIPLVMTAIKASYWLNYPNHVAWGANNRGVGHSGTGYGEPVFYGPPVDEISNPNDRLVFTAWTYRRWPAPYRQTVEDLRRSAMLEVNTAPVQANADFATLTAAWANKTLIDL